MMSPRDRGNEKFKAGEYKEAEQCYTEGIQLVPKDPKLFSNRALTRLKLRDWRNAETDARKAIELHGNGSAAAMKSYYYLAQALVELRHTTEALNIAQEAYRLCLQTRDSSTEVVSQFILRAKKAHWETRETARLRELNHTLGVVEELLDEKLDRDEKEVDQRYYGGELGLTGRTEEIEQLRSEARDQRKLIRTAFANPTKPDTSERSIPEYMIDAITFEIMHDPVVTPAGHSYERAGLLKHIRNAGTDPMTRTPLGESQLIDNVALRGACADFLEANGWAVDY